jgi:hydrogenase-1 operon protein HyaE
MTDAIAALNGSAASLDTSVPEPEGAHGLLKQLVVNHQGQWVDQASLANWQGMPGQSVLLLPGDPVRFPEGLDVAVVLPELRRAVRQAFRIGVVTPADDLAIGQRFGAQRRPCLVFLRDGRYLDTVAGMHDWQAYVELVHEALASTPSPAPIAIGVAGGGAPSSCH